MTVGIKEQTFPIPFGVAELKNGKLLEVTEKPTLNFPILTGIYVINQEVLAYISGKEYLDMTDLIQILIKDRKLISLYSITEYWKDIGSIEDFAEVTKDSSEW